MPSRADLRRRRGDTATTAWTIHVGDAAGSGSDSRPGRRDRHRYKGNEELVAGLESGSITEAEAWRPWFRASDDSNNYAPAGYVTTYSVSDKAYESKGPDFAFLTIRLAGHMVPTFQPEAALTFVSNFVSGSAY